MLNQEKYDAIAAARYRKAGAKLADKVKFSAKMFPIILVIVFVVFYVMARTSGLPENRTYPLWKLLLDALIFDLFAVVIGLIVAEKSLIFRFRKLKRHQRDGELLRQLFSSEKKFAFYLRDFKSGRTSSSYYAFLPGGNSGFQEAMGSSEMAYLTRKVNRYLPVVLLDNENELTDHYSGIPYYTTNEDWYRDFEFLAKGCFFVIIDYALEFNQSSNIEAEINFLMAHELKVMICAKSVHLEALLLRYPKLKAHMLFHIPVEVIQAGPVFGPKQDAFNTVTLPKEVKLFLRSI